MFSQLEGYSRAYRNLALEFCTGGICTLPMPQIFHPSTNTFSKASIFGAVFILIGIAATLAAFYQSPYITKVNYPIEQPIPFSHERHVGGLGLDCRYCHTSVDNSSFAGIPPTHTCMTCHSQIWTESEVLAPVRDSYSSNVPIEWVRVNDLADFVYFNHEAHVNKGVGCETCHGRVDEMPLTSKAHTLYMSWCLDCHRNPEDYLRPKDKVFEMGYVPEEDQAVIGARLVQEYNIAPESVMIDCYTCHR